jgi:RNA polymerase sigma factor (TIGR02999 family)
MLRGHFVYSIYESGTGSMATAAVTQLLSRWRGGDRAALDALIPLVYRELRRIAERHLHGERPGHMLQTTALVHEAYLRMVAQDPPDWQNRAHFFGVAAQLMRQILVDHARAENAAKRGSGACKLTLDRALMQVQNTDVDILKLDEALGELARMDPRQCRIVELRFFAGLSVEETSEILGISSATVTREWATARAWLYRELVQRPRS